MTLIAGAGGHAKELLDILIRQHNTNGICFFDNTPSLVKEVYDKYPVLKTEKQAQDFFLDYTEMFHLGIGSPKTRSLMYVKLSDLGGKFQSVQSPDCLISSNADDIASADIFPFAIVGPNVLLGKGVLVNARAHVHHEVQIGDFTEISPAAVILGAAKVGAFCQVGAGAIILPKVTVGSNVVIGAGCVVTKNVPDNTLVVGVPGRVIKYFHKRE